MSNDPVTASIERLSALLRSYGPVAVAVSGGVDSMTLAYVAHRAAAPHCSIYHAVSPAVPASATARVRRRAAAESWDLHVIDAREFDDPRYLENPADRCFFCKQNLYAAITAQTESQVVSGTNLDDLKDWRPGLKAAANHAVRHPLVEAEIDKAGVRRIAHFFGLEDIAELPAAPCLSSRVETGIRIVPRDLRFVDAAERFIQGALAPETVRCRVRSEGIVIELDNDSHAKAGDAELADLAHSLEELGRTHGIAGTVSFATYTRGSAFLREPS